ncbi:MAG: nucleotidyltransferase domain-containing protein [Clostridia bacterium]|nr:nucleotidyltransferase domain-containing protein [Clostridia bacterium]
MIQMEFKMLVDEALTHCKAYFGDRFLSAYLHGSIEKGDAIAGVSDLDMVIISSEVDAEKDTLWIRRLIEELQENHPEIDEAHIMHMSREQLEEDRFTRFALTYNAALMAGENIAKTLNDQDPEGYLPDKRIAKMRLNFARACLSEAMSGRVPSCTGELPENTYYAARKYARYFVVIEGAYYLMAINQFTSFAKASVLEGLRTHAGMFVQTIDLVETVLSDPIAAGIRHDEFISAICSFTNWMFDQIEAS